MQIHFLAPSSARMRMLIASACVSIQHSAVVASDECFELPPEMWIPRTPLYASQVTASSSASTPNVVDFSGSDKYYITLGRPSESGGGPYRLQFSMREKSGTGFVPICSTHWKKLSGPIAAKDYFVHGTVGSLDTYRLEIFENRQGVESYEPMNVKVTAYPDAPQRDSGADLQCSSTSGKAPEKPLRGKAQVQSEIAHPLDAKPTLFAQSARGISIQAESMDGLPLPPLTFNVSAKWPGYNAYSASLQCPMLGPPGQRSATSDAVSIEERKDPSRELIYRVEVDAASDMGTGLAKRVRIKVAGSSIAPQTLVASGLQYLCQNSLDRRSRNYPASELPFAGRTKLSVQIEDSSETLGLDARDSLTRELLLAIQMWRWSCHGCTWDNLSVAAIDEDIYVLSPLLNDEFMPMPAGRDSAADRFNRPYGSLISRLSTRTGGRGDSDVHFKLLRRKDPAYQRICALPSADLPLQMRQIQESIGCIATAGSASSQSNSSRLRVRLLPGFTSCGNDTDVVACEKDASKVELNAKHYRFDSLTGQTILGRGERRVPLLPILLHEVGHWIGIDHLPEADNIMSEYLDQAKCLDDTSANALTILARGGSYPMKKPLALRYGSPAKPAPSGSRTPTTYSR